MLTIRVYRTPDRQVHGLRSVGHADYAEEGSDIVCAGISALLQTALLGLVQVVGAHPSYTVEKGQLHLALAPEELAGTIGEHSRVRLESTLLGLAAIASQYPKHVRIQEFCTPTPN